MTNERLYCEVAECDRPVAGHGKGFCSSHMKQWQRTGKTQKIAEKLPPIERAIEAGNAWLGFEGDDEDEELKKRAYVNACKDVGNEAKRRIIKEAIESARARGIRLGRPPKVDLKKLRDLMQLKTPDLIALVLGVSRATLFRAKRSLTRRSIKTNDYETSSPRGDARPRSG